MLETALSQQSVFNLVSCASPEASVEEEKKLFLRWTSSLVVANL